MKTVSAENILLMNTIYQFLSTQVAEGLVFRKHTVCSSCLTWHFILARNLQTKDHS